MLHKNNSLVTLAILLALFGVSKPARAFLIAQSDIATTTFTVPDKLNQNATIQIAASDSSGINQTLTEKFIAKYPQAQVKIETQASDSALESLLAGKTDLVAIGRSLTLQEKAQGLLAIPVSREKIAVDDLKYLSQPFSLVYQGTPSEAVQAYLGFATAEDGNQIITSRVGANNTERDYPSSTSNPADLIRNGDRTTANALQTNPDADLNESGEINPDVAGSGEINPDVAGSGEINPDVAGSGEINPDVAGSGEINPDVVDSGEPLSSNTVDESTAPEVKIAQNAAVTPDAINANSQTAPEVKIAQNAAVTPDAINANSQTAPEVKIAQNEAVTPDAVDGDTPEAQTSENENKWWWWLPIIIGVPLLGAIAASAARRKKSDREPALGNIPDDDSPNGNRGGSPTPGNGGLSAVGATNVSDLGNNSNATGIGNAAIATGGAATNFVGGRSKTEGDLVNEIPSNPVSEFTGQETQLQITDQPTQLQTDAEDESDFNSYDEDLSQPSGIGMAGGAASELLSDRDSTDEMTTNLRENDAIDYFQTDTDVSQQQNNPQTTLSDPSLSEVKSDEVIETDRGTNTNIAREFRGDFVLDEETERRRSFEPEIDTSTTATDIDSTETLTSIPETDSGEIADSTTPELDLDLDLFDDKDIITNTDVEVTESFNRGLDIEQAIDAEFSSGQDTVIDIGLDESGSGEIADSTSPELDLFDDRDTVIDANSDLNISDRTSQSGAAIAEGTAVSGFFNREQDVEQSTNFPELDDFDTSLETTRDDFSDSDNVIADVDIQAVPNDVDGSLEEITFDDAENATDYTEPTILDATQTTSVALSLDEISFDDKDDSFNSSLEEITFDDAENATDYTEPTILDATQTTSAALSLDEISFDDEDDSFNSSLEEITFDETENATDFSLDETIVDAAQTTSADLSLEEISFDDEDDSFNFSLDEITFDETENATDYSLDETILDATQSTSTNGFVNNLDTTTQNQDIDLDDLGFDESESTDSLSFDLLSDNMAEITSLSDDQSNDMNNISEWLDSLDTHNQNTDNISEWLDTLNTNNLDSILEDGNQETAFQSSEEEDDISFQFLEDLLERDSNSNRDAQ